MSLLDKVVAAVTPLESDEARVEARDKATSVAQSGDWLSMVLEHHRAIEAAFDSVKAASSEGVRLMAQKKLALLLTAHSIAEEAVLYPAMAKANEKGHATMAYAEQSAAKLEMGLLEGLAPMSQEYLDKLEHIRGAVLHHVYQEEGTWFIQVKESLSADDQVKLTARYREEFERYLSRDEARAGDVPAVRRA